MNEVKSLSSEYPMALLYNMYAGWCIQRIVDQDTRRIVCKDHSNVI